MKTKKIIVWGAIVLIIVMGLVSYLLWGRHYTVIFDSQSTNNYAAQTIRIGQKVTKPNDPARVGYIFLGWYKDNEKYDFTEPVKKDLTLVAKWQEIVDKS